MAITNTSTVSKAKSSGTKAASAKSSPAVKTSAASKAKAPVSKSSKSSVTSAAKTKGSAGAGKASASRKPTAAAEKQGLLSSIVDKASSAVTGMFAADDARPNAIDLLKNDHRVVEDLFAKVEANEGGNNAPVFKKIKMELDTHMHIEETVFYPFLLEKGKKDIKKIVQEGIEEHRQAKMFLSELSSLSGTTDKFKAKIKVLMEDIEHHVKEEEDEMFSMVEDQFGKDVLQELGAKMEAKKAAFKKSGNSSSKSGKAVAKKAA